MTTMTSDRPSIVVLPFVNMSADPEQEYFCDGMAEEVINTLAQLEGLHVVARTSAFSFKGRDIDVREVGEQLGVRSVLEGSVRKAGDRLRVTAQLVDVADGYHVWSERFDRRLEDVFAIQDEIAASIVDRLKVELALGAGSQESAKRTTSQEAYDLYLRGMHHRWLQNESDLWKALECFEQAVALDGDFAAAHAGVAMVYALLYSYGLVRSDQIHQKAEEAALRSVELDEHLAEAHDALGCVRGWIGRDFESSESALERAVELNPGDVSARVHYAYSLLMAGRTRDALAEFRRAQELDPLSLVVNQSLGVALFFDRQFDEAIRQLRNTLEMAPDFPRVREFLVFALSSSHRPEEAAAERQEMLRRAGREEDARELQNAYTEGGEVSALQWFIRSRRRLIDNAEAEGATGDVAFELALHHAYLGETEEAFGWIEEALRQRSSDLLWITVHPWLDSLRPDPRFGEILKTAGFL